MAVNYRVICFIILARGEKVSKKFFEKLRFQCLAAALLLARNVWPFAKNPFRIITADLEPGLALQHFFRAAMNTAVR